MPSRNGPRLLESTMPKIVRRHVPPTEATLRKYGLTADDWHEMARQQRGICPVCQEPFGDRKLAIDHEHVRGFRARKRRKGKKKRDGVRVDVRVRVMQPEERRRHVRGILHSWCNRFVRRWLTLCRARSIVAYLEAHEQRRKMEIINAR